VDHAGASFILGPIIDKVIEDNCRMWRMNCFYPSTASTVIEIGGFGYGKILNQGLFRWVYIEYFNYPFDV
jgi:hypothetical protein